MQNQPVDAGIFVVDSAVEAVVGVVDAAVDEEEDVERPRIKRYIFVHMFRYFVDLYF